MWCIPKITQEFIAKMEDVLTLYARPYDPKEPVLCFDETSKQLLRETRTGIPCAPHRPRRIDHEYERHGTRNIFMTVEPKGGYRSTKATARRTKIDFSEEIRRIIRLPRYREARKIHIVLDNLNTHGERSLNERFGEKETRRMMRRVSFHHTPKHASWLNMAEIELSVMDRQCTKKRIPSSEALTKDLTAWQVARNRARAIINWSFTTADARKKFKYSQRGKDKIK